MKTWIGIVLAASSIAAGAAVAADTPDLEPAVRTSSAATESSGPKASSAAPAAGAAVASGAGGSRTGAKARDSIDLDATQITGNRELPNVMYVVPWKKPDLGDFAGRPPKSLLDELLAPVDRDVFRRQNRYFAALHPDAAKPEVAAPAALPASGAPATLPAGDEK